ncbi:MAG: hypothetical protein ACOC80_01280 [Petrotogales bacterium]
MILLKELVEIIKENISSSGFYTFYKNRVEKVKRINRLFHQSSDIKLKNFMIRSNNYPNVSSLDSSNISFIIDILKEKRGEPASVHYVANLINATIQETGSIAYFLFPKRNPPVSGILVNKITLFEDYLNWIKIAQRLVPNIIDNYKMLESALLFSNNTSVNSTEKSSYKAFEEIDHKHITDIKKLRRTFDKANKSERKNIIDSIKNDYVKKVVTSKVTTETIIDGSNIIYSGTDFPDIAKIDRLFIRTFSRINTVFFPYRIIFDANVRYMVKGFQQKELEKWIALPQTELYSPADDRILQLANTRNACVISYDRFLEYETNAIAIYKPEDLYES